MEDLNHDLNQIILIASKVKEKARQYTLEGNLTIEIGAMKEVVSMVLDHSEEARNDDNILFRDCKAYCDSLKIPYTSKTQETWRRCRQYFQSKGWWEASVEVKQARAAKAVEWQKHFK